MGAPIVPQGSPAGRCRSAPAGAGNAVIADGSGPEVSLDIKGEKTYGRIKITENYPGSVRL